MNRKQIQIFVFICIAVITLGIGYAAISSIILTINGTGTVTVNSNNFNVHFDTTVNPTITQNMGNATIDGQNNKVAHIAVTGLTKVGDTATAEYTVINESNGVGAEISLDLINTNTSYFKVTETIVKKQLQAGQSTKVRIIVELLKTPIEDIVSTDITGTLEATAIDNTDATSTAGASVVRPTAFAQDSWSTIKTNITNNNTDQYNIGDTKIVTIGGNNYTVRLVNKTVGDHCGDNDTGYSQTACGFVVEFAEVVETRAMNSTPTNVGGWPATEMRTYLNGTFFNSLPNDLQSAIKPTRVISGYGCVSGWDNSTSTCSNPDNSGSNFTSTDNIYLLSGAELTGTDECDTSSGATHQLEYYIGQSTEQVEDHTTYPRIKKQINSSNYYYWLRTAHFGNRKSFRYVTSNAYLSHIYAYTSEFGFAPAFRIG